MSVEILPVNSNSPEKFREHVLNLQLSVDMPNSTAESLHKTSGFLDVKTAPNMGGQIIESQSLGLTQELIGVVYIDKSNSIGVLRATHNGKNTVVLSKLVKQEGGIEERSRAQLLGVVDQGAEVVIGRNQFGTENVEEISSKHVSFNIGSDGKLEIKDISTNGSSLVKFESPSQNSSAIAPRGLRKFLNKKKNQNTKKSAKPIEIADFLNDFKSWTVKSQELVDSISPIVKPDAEWGYTVMPEKLNRTALMVTGYEEQDPGQELPARYLDRNVISRDSQINGGVYIVPKIQEAIVVDDGRGKLKGDAELWSPVKPAYAKAYTDFLRKASGNGISIEHGVKNGEEAKVVKAAYEAAQELLQYDAKYAEDISKIYGDKKIDLGSFTEEGKGACRHQALLAGYFLERVVKSGYMSGNVSVDRNYIKGEGGHAWARFTSFSGVVYIADPAQQYVGTLKDAMSRRETWNYSRPEDIL